jgi:hypothetical protein
MFSPTRFSVPTRSAVANAFTAKSALRCAVQIAALATGIGYENLVHTLMWCRHWLGLFKGRRRIHFGVCHVNYQYPRLT